MKKLLIIGAGGMGREVAWLVQRINEVTPTWQLLGFLDDSPTMVGKTVNDLPVLGGCQTVQRYPDAFVVCAIAAADIRKKVIRKLELACPNVKYATLIDPSAVVSQYAKIGEGSIICIHAVVSVDVKVGKHVIINYGCTVGHDAVLGDYSMVYPAASISGNVTLGAGCEIGTGARIIQGKTVSDGAILGAGAVVIRDIPANCTAVGCPAGIIKHRSVTE